MSLFLHFMSSVDGLKGVSQFDRVLGLKTLISKNAHPNRPPQKPLAAISSLAWSLVFGECKFIVPLYI